MKVKTTTLFPVFFLLFLTIAIQSALAESPDKFRFIVMSDMFFGATSPEEYKSAVREMKKYKPDFVLFLGDMVDTVGDKATQNRNRALVKAFENNVKLSSREVESLWRDFDRITKKLGVPVYDIPGGRSIPLNNIAATEKAFLKRYPGRYYTFEYKNNLFVCLDSEYYNATSLGEQFSVGESPKIIAKLYFSNQDLITGPQFEFLAEALSDTSKYNNVFMAVHKCAWETSPGQLHRWHVNVHSFINGRVGYVFGADGFSPFNLQKADEVTYVTSGAALFNPTLGEESSFRHFVIVDVDGKAVSLKIVPLGPVTVEELAGLQSDKFSSASKLVPVDRTALLQIPEVIETLKIKPGMTVVDIGAGRGIFTFPLADALKGTGKVFATDIEQDLLDGIAREAQEKRYKNIFPVKVRAKGVDPFYREHVFDIILVSCLYEGLIDQEEFFRGLGPSLAKGSGRLYNISFKPDPDFVQEEFSDFKNVIELLLSKGDDFPVFKRLSRENQQFIKSWRGEDVPPEVQEKIVDNLNVILNDRTFFKDFMKYGERKEFAHPFVILHYYVHPADLRLVKGLAADLETEDVFTVKAKTLSEAQQNRLRVLNRLLLMGIFQTQAIHDIHDLDSVLFQNKKSIIATLEEAGYRFIREYDFHKHHYFLEFGREE